MANQLHVQVVAVEEPVWAGDAEMLVARTTEGEIGIMPGHAPLLGLLKEPSQVRVKLAGGEQFTYDVTCGGLPLRRHPRGHPRSPRALRPARQRRTDRARCGFWKIVGICVAALLVLLFAVFLRRRAAHGRRRHRRLQVRVSTTVPGLVSGWC